MSELCAFILHAHTRAEKSAEFEALFSGYVASSRAEAGCVEYHMLRDAKDPTLYIFFEVWQSTEQFEAHCALPHMREFNKRRVDFLTRDFMIQPIQMLSPASAIRNT